MFVLNNLKMPYKYTSVTADDNNICVRIFSPIICKTAINSINLDSTLSTESILGSLFLNDSANIICTHEVRLNRSNDLWNGGNHLIFYTTPDLYVAKVLAVARKEDLKNLPAVTVLAEVLCADKNQKCCAADFCINADPKGSLFTNLNQGTTEGPFKFQISVSYPKFAESNSLFPVEVSMKDYSGNPVNGYIIVEAFSGYIPNRIITISEGISKFVCSSLLVDDKVTVKICDLIFSVGIKNE